jgi:hypothetical protein
LQRIGLAAVEIARPHDVNMTQARLDVAFARRPENPLDETGGEEQRNYAEGYRRNAEQAAAILPRDVAESIDVFAPRKLHAVFS